MTDRGRPTGRSPLGTILRRALDAHAMTRPGQVVGVALSGGPDSTALLSLMAEAAPSRSVTLVVLHFDHAYRDGSAEDARFAEETARRLGLPFRLGVNPDPKPATGLMAAARKARYRFFDDALDEGFCDTIALAHTMDDVAESALMRMLRGGGPGAFGGPRPVRGRFIRPLLDARKAELLAHLRERGIPWRDDPTNANATYLRTRVRATILPALLAEEPTAVEAVARLARQVAAQEEVVAAAATGWIDAKGAPLPLVPFREALPGLRHALIRLAALNAGCALPLAAERVEEVERLAREGAPGATVELGGGYAARIDQATLSFGPSRRPPAPEPLPFAVPLAVAWGEGTLAVGGEAGDPVAAGSIPADARFRCRRPGDWLAPPAGRRSLKRFLIDKKVAASTRALLPLLAVGDRILWIPGGFVDATLVPHAGEATIRLSFRKSD